MFPSQTKLQARKALSKNGKVYSGNIMIGVVTCSDKVSSNAVELIVLRVDCQYPGMYYCTVSGIGKHFS